MRRTTMLGVILTVLLFGILPTASAQSADRCFAETGFCITGAIRTFWEKNGGLPVFGFPIGPQQEEQIEGNALQVQRFERNRLELHPENRAPYDVLLGRLGADRLAQQSRDWQAVFPKSEAQPGCRYFGETGHNVCGDILKAWRANGLEIDGRKGKTEAENLALLGLPLSDLVTEATSDGKEYQLQWFERGRFELHPENQPPYNVLLGLLGNEIRDNGGAAAPVPAPVSQAIVLSGSGAKVTDPITLPSQYNRIVSVHQGGSSNFIVWAYNQDNDQKALIANTIGDFTGSRPLEGKRTVFFEVKADGNWTLTIEPLPQDGSVANGLSGHGEYVSGLFQPARVGNVPLVLAHDGGANFIVWLRCAGRASGDLVVNEIGAYQGETIAEFQKGPCYWDVRADGNWSIAKK